MDATGGILEGRFLEQKRLNGLGWVLQTEVLNEVDHRNTY